MDDIRYVEFSFLQGVANGQIRHFDRRNPLLRKLPGQTDVEMVVTLLEELSLQIRDQWARLLVARLRGDLAIDYDRPNSVAAHWWENPRLGIEQILTANSIQEIEITFRGLRRIEELRDQLRADRIVEPFGVLLDLRYFRRDLEDALRRAPDVPVSVLYADMDNFKRINDEFGHAAGDVVMKAYLECVKEGLSIFGEGYRGRGDETIGLIVGQSHKQALEIAQGIRKRVAELRCEYKGKRLPSVTTSIGLATAPPVDRMLEIESVADARQQQAKARGKNRVVAA